MASSLDARFLDRGLALLETFNQIPSAAILETMRDLDLFSERSVSVYYVVRNELFKILEPAAGMADANCPQKKDSAGDRPSFWRTKIVSLRSWVSISHP